MSTQQASHLSLEKRNVLRQFFNWIMMRCQPSYPNKSERTRSQWREREDLVAYNGAFDCAIKRSAPNLYGSINDFDIISVCGTWRTHHFSNAVIVFSFFLFIFFHLHLHLHHEHPPRRIRRRHRRVFFSIIATKDWFANMSAWWAGCLVVDPSLQGAYNSMMCYVFTWHIMSCMIVKNISTLIIFQCSVSYFIPFIPISFSPRF